LYAAHLQETQIYDTFNYNKDCGFLIGNEGNGLTEESTAMADHLLKIPMGGQLESLNAAMAAGILMYEVNRQRRGDERADLV
jgi:TrmH family RNA methyltransferase